MNQTEYDQMFIQLRSLFSPDIAHLYVAVEKCVILGYQRPKKVTMMVDAELNNALEKNSSYVSVNEAERLKLEIGNYHWANITPEQRFAYIQRAQDMLDNSQFD
jgi:hypothetical protein